MILMKRPRGRVTSLTVLRGPHKIFRWNQSDAEREEWIGRAIEGPGAKEEG